MSDPYLKFVEALHETNSSISFTSGAQLIQLELSYDLVEELKRYFIIKDSVVTNLSDKEFHITQCNDLPYTFRHVKDIEYFLCSNTNYISLYKTIPMLAFNGCTFKEFDKPFTGQSIHLKDCELTSLDSITGEVQSIMVDKANKFEKIGGTKDLKIYGSLDIIIKDRVISAENDLNAMHSFTFNSNSKVTHLLNLFKFVEGCKSCGIIANGMSLYHIVIGWNDQPNSSIYDFAGELLEHGFSEDEVCI